ncbi:hypothetical protein [Aureimonas mangrovi]|uniref:hypothetical protein n=1 Tax=Aureimonas mangrovi TaxID=2758041 RepID=UPI00163D9204|nr:hypothetical protein [Aureimonas mangrovi]
MARAHNIMLGFPNRIDQCEITGGAWVESLPLANLRNRLFSRVARSASAAENATQMVLDLGDPKSIRVLGLIAHTITLQGRLRIEASQFADFRTLVHDTGFRDAWGGLIGAPWMINELEWESDNYWYGTYSREQVEGFTAVSVHVLDAPVFARFWRLSIQDARNPAGFIQIGRLFIGEGVQPRINYSWGAGAAYETGTQVETALGGAEFFDVREPVRVFRFTLEHMADEEAFGTFQEIVRRAGIHGELMVIPDPTDLYQGLRRNFMGRLRQLSPLEQVTWMNGGSAHSMAFEIKELR